MHPHSFSPQSVKQRPVFRNKIPKLLAAGWPERRPEDGSPSPLEVVLITAYSTAIGHLLRKRDTRLSATTHALVNALAQQEARQRHAKVPVPKKLCTCPIYMRALYTCVPYRYARVPFAAARGCCFAFAHTTHSIEYTLSTH